LRKLLAANRIDRKILIHLPIPAHLNGGIKTFSVGAFNEASKELLETMKMYANVAADRALANGTASS